jgi:hypothetical protein
MASPTHGGLVDFLQNFFRSYLVLYKDDEKFSTKQKQDKGVKGILPLVCLPLWRREGVTLTT